MKRLKSSTMEVYVKGAPEVMVDICEKDSCTPSNFPLFVEADNFAGSPSGL